jgi:hypothetical protein
MGFIKEERPDSTAAGIVNDGPSLVKEAVEIDRRGL